jgi:hypothetical protein
MKKFILWISILANTLLYNCSFSQNLAAWQDLSGGFYVFDNGDVKKLFHQDVPFFNVVGDKMIYRDIKNDTYYYSNKQSTKIESFKNDEAYTLTKKYLVGTRGNNLQIYTTKGWRSLLIGTSSFKLTGDSIVVFMDNFGVIKALHNNEVKEISNSEIKNYAVSDNGFAFTDPFRKLLYYHNEEVVEVDNLGANFMRLTNHHLLYIDNYNNLVCFTNPIQEDICSFTFNYDYEEDQQLQFENRIWAGDDYFAYIDDDLNLYVHNGDKAILLRNDYKSKLIGIDNTLLYHNINDGLSVFYNGKSYDLETYYPAILEFSDGVVAYMDLNNKLKIFYEGKTTLLDKESLSIPREVTINNQPRHLPLLKVFGRCVLYRTGNYDAHIFHDGMVKY